MEALMTMLSEKDWSITSTYPRFGGFMYVVTYLFLGRRVVHQRKLRGSLWLLQLWSPGIMESCSLPTLLGVISFIDQLCPGA